jgi:transcriptional regulator with XRE-family HTH domain
MAERRGFKAKGFQDARYRAVISALVDKRKAKGLSQDAFAALIGRHQQFVSRYESGERRLDFVELVDVARALGLDGVALMENIPTAES